MSGGVRVFGLLNCVRVCVKCGLMIFIFFKLLLYGLRVVWIGLCCEGILYVLELDGWEGMWRWYVGNVYVG